MQKHELLKAGFAFDYDHISLVPRVISTLQHRADASPDVQLGDCRLRLPLIGSPMSDVCGTEMCSVLSHEGAAGILHRFQGIRSQARSFKEARGREAHAAVGAAIGVTNSFQEQFQTLYDAGCRLFCLDTANGAHKQVEQAIAWIHHVSDDIFLIAGNVASAETFSWLEDLGVDAIRVGIAGGSVCETRTETGVYVPTPYAIAEVAAVRKRAMIIGDGGVRTPSDFCKLLALGADVVMLGSALAGTQEAPGQVVMADGKQYKIMRGSASFSVQQQGGKEAPEYVEGTETLVPYRGSVVAVLHRYMAGLRSSMSYMNARTLEEYRNNASFVLLR